MTAQTPLDRLKAAMGEGWECRVEEPDDACREWYAVARLYCNAFVQVSAIEPTPDAAVDALLAARDAAFPSTRHGDMVRGATLVFGTLNAWSFNYKWKPVKEAMTIDGAAERIVSEWEREQEAGR